MWLGPYDEMIVLLRGATSLGAPFARTLSAVQRLVYALLNEMFRVIRKPAVRQQRRQLVRRRGRQPGVDILQVSQQDTRLN